MYNSKIKKKGKNYKRQQLVEKIFNPNENGFSNWIIRDELAKTKLKLSDNGNQRHGKFFNVKIYNYESKMKSNKVIKIKLNGFDKENNNFNKKRPIRKDIRDYYKNQNCVVCGSKSNLVTDHKNDLYNDIRVLNTKTQTIDDFQSLCTHCNLQKKEVCIKTRKTNKRYGATNIPSLKIFGIDFIEGDENFDKNDINDMKGTYWYDPIEFQKKIG